MTKRAVFLGALLLAASPAGAQSPGTFEIGGFARYGFFDNDLRYEDEIGGGGYLGVYVVRNLAIEAEGSYLGTSSEVTLADITEIPLRLRLTYNVPLGGWASSVQLGAGYVYDLYNLDDPLDDFKNHGVTGLLGLRLGLSRVVAIRVAGTVDYAPSPDQPLLDDYINYGVQGGLSLLFGNKYDRDKDGVTDKADRCPGTPAGQQVDPAGCSASQRDSDGDRVTDNRDKCPSTPAGETVDADGCSAAQKDADKDGVTDAADKCPDTPAGEQVDANGCTLPKDADGDGVTDQADKCPDTPAGEQVDANGCTLPKDADGANTPAGVQVDAIGCRVLFQEARRRMTLEGVKFQTGKSALTPESESVLNDVAAALIANSDVSVEVAGHTDNTGSAAVNKRISQARADAVRQYLIGKGVPADRLTARGYGESQPVAPNKTAEGRAQNRRVDLNRTK
jgi:OOP family OmpA-OmpF porin